jgi:hypothetical protein
MIESDIQRLKRLRLPKLKGTWSEIVKIVDTFRIPSKPNSTWIYKSTDGFLIRFVGVTKHYTRYIYTEENIGKLYLRKRSNCFMQPGDCGTHDLSDQWNYIFELVEIPEDLNVDMFKFRNTYNIKFAAKKQYEYY